MTDADVLQTQQRSTDETYLAQLPDWMNAIETIWQDIQQKSWNGESGQQLIHQAHRLVGISDTLGYTRIGAAARHLEQALRNMSARLQTDEVLKATERDALTDYIHSLRRAVQDHRRNATRNEPPMKEPSKGTQSLQETRSGQLIYLVDDDLIQAKELAAQIAYFGYQVRIFDHPKWLENSLNDELPAALLMDILFPEGNISGAEAVAALRGKLPGPVIFISVRDDLQTRLQAVQAGGEAYFPKPVNTGQLIDVLDRLTVQEDPVPFRVLVVDDSLVQANYNAMHLRKAGMQVEVVTDPTHVFPPLVEFNPDLILLDMYMPDCTGMELAKIIRQVETFVSIPIVYLSAETDREKQLQAVGLGGDDFLTKPIKPSHLISAVTSRVTRYRKLRSLMLHDSLTGLFNHTTTRERLAQEIARSSRQDIPLSYAMLDLDHFKQVNDSYGHAAGDRVLKSLAQMLTKRLRTSDVIGRYGGEEFAVILPGTPGPAAVGVMNEMREAFACIRHRSGDVEFSVTFSCGVSAYPGYSTPTSMSEAADQAMYTAKRLGRNQVVFADPARSG